MGRRLPIWGVLVIGLIAAIVAIVVWPHSGSGEGDSTPPPPAEYLEAIARARDALESRRWPDAVEAATQAAAVAPDRAEPHEIVGEAELARGRHIAALAAFDKAVERNPNSARAWAGTARVHLRRALARRHAPLALIEDGRVVAVFRRDADFEAEQAALRAFERAVYTLDSEAPERTLARAADAFFHAADYDAVVLVLSGMSDPDAALLRGAARFWSGEVERARAEWRAAAEAIPQDGSWRPLLGAAEWLCGDHARARELLEGERDLAAWWSAMDGADVESPPADAEGSRWFLSGWCAFRAGRYAEAIEMLGNALRARFGPAHYPYAACAERLGRVEDLERALDISTEVHFPELYAVAARRHARAAAELSRRGDEAAQAGRTEEAAALRAEALRRWVAAWRSFDDYHRLDPDGRAAPPWSAEEARRMERDISAARAEALRPDPSYLIMRATLKVFEGRPDDARADLRDAERELATASPAPPQSEIYERALSYWMAYALQRSRSLLREGAIRYRARCAEVDPGHVANAFALAAAEFAAQDFDSIIRRMTNLVERRPFFARAYDWRGWAYEESLKWEEAVADAVRRDILGDAGGTRALAALAVLLEAPGVSRRALLARSAHREEAERFAEELLRRSRPPQPQTDWAHEADEARRALANASGSEADTARIRLAGALWMLGDAEEAQRIARQIPEAARPPATWYLLGRMLWSSGRADEAKEALQAALRLDPVHAQSWALRAQIAFEQGDAQGLAMWLVRWVRTVWDRPFDVYAVPVVEEDPGPDGGPAIVLSRMRPALR